MNRDDFLNDDLWLGSYYELGIELGPTGDDARLVEAVEHIWSLPQLHGAWTTRASFNESPSPIEIEIEIVEGFVQPRYGILQLSSGHRLGCVTHTVRETDGSDWLDLCIPTGMLELVFDLNYPLDYTTNAWMRSIDQDLAQIAAAMFRNDPYLLAIIGEEVSGTAHAKSITADNCRNGPFLIPENLWRSLGLNCEHEFVAPGLVAIGLVDPE